jgi:hypothetical protein
MIEDRVWELGDKRRAEAVRGRREDILATGGGHGWPEAVNLA